MPRAVGKSYDRKFEQALYRSELATSTSNSSESRRQMAGPSNTQKPINGQISRNKGNNLQLQPEHISLKLSLRSTLSGRAA